MITSKILVEVADYIAQGNLRAAASRLEDMAKLCTEAAVKIRTALKNDPRVHPCGVSDVVTVAVVGPDGQEKKRVTVRG